MIKKRLLVVFFLMGFVVSAQIKGVVVDENDMPIPYVNIWFENGALVTTSEENGTFSLEIKNQEKNLIFSALGFETKMIDAKETEKVVLKQVNIKLEEVEIKRNFLKQQKEIGYYESWGFRWHENYFVSAIFFNLTEEERELYPFIKEIKFRTLSENKNAKIRIYLVAVNKDGSPSENTLSDELIIEVKKGNSKSKIDFSTMKIAIPENGFFIVFEKLKIEQNKHYEEYYFKDKNGNKTTHKGLYYQPEIALVPVKEAVGWNKRVNDKWEKTAKKIMQKPNSYENLLMKKYHNNYLVPAVNLTITN